MLRNFDGAGALIEQWLKNTHRQSRRNAKPAPQAPLFGHLKPLPQSLSPEERTSQFLQNNRLASSRKRQ